MKINKYLRKKILKRFQTSEKVILPCYIDIKTNKPQYQAIVDIIAQEGNNYSCKIKFVLSMNMHLFSIIYYLIEFCLKNEVAISRQLYCVR